MMFLVSLVFSCVVAQNSNWDFLLYVERWPGTLTQDRLPANITSFTLHGMWPERNDDTWPQFCNPNAPYSHSAISSILPLMLKLWPNLDFGHGHTADSFWDHEWTKHGTCAADGSMPGISDELSFFTYALKTHAKLPFSAALQRAGIVPDSSATYSLSQINNAFSSLSYSVIPWCEKDRKTHSLNLMRLYTCIDKTGTLIICPSQVITDLTGRSDCDPSSPIGFPPINH
jgi:ribonuclease T2